MIVTFANQKGGAGKTTNCIQFANYLAYKEKEVILFDVDFQRSIYDRRKEDKELFDNEIPYEVIEVEAEKIVPLLKEAKKIENEYILIDMPGKIDDDNLGIILEYSDVIIIPFNYDKLTLDSTSLFIQILEMLELKSKKIYLPNRIKTGVKYSLMEEANKILSQFGLVAPIISDRVAMERINTIQITQEAIKVVEESYDFIIKEINTNK